MDISPDNLALRYDGHRMIITILDSGGCVVFKEITHAPMSVRNTSMAATGAVAAHTQSPALSGKVDGVCFLSPTFVRDHRIVIETVAVSVAWPTWARIYSGRFVFTTRLRVVTMRCSIKRSAVDGNPTAQQLQSCSPSVALLLIRQAGRHGSKSSLRRALGHLIQG